MFAFRDNRSTENLIQTAQQTARDYGLIGPITQPAELSWSFSLFRFGIVHWSVLPGLTPVWIGMKAENKRLD